jgi:hypothetical protein
MLRCVNMGMPRGARRACSAAHSTFGFVCVAMWPALLTDGHGSVVVPPPRQAIDRNLAPWNGVCAATYGWMVQTVQVASPLLLCQSSQLEWSMDDVCVCVSVCVLSHCVHAAMDEAPDLPSLKCSSHWSLGLFPASVRTMLCDMDQCRPI